jgi:ArsR family transcriptional regulator, lead/cadmium/zinc/bismuth-responsive transcriptional repressor
MIRVPEERCDLLCLDLPLAEELRRRRPDERAVRRVAGEFRALADPTRQTVALALREADELCVCDLAWILERAQNLISHHLRALRAEGLVDYRREGKMALYSLTERGRALLDLAAVADPAATVRD